jgi:hypothetical protein
MLEHKLSLNTNALTLSPAKPKLEQSQYKNSYLLKKNKHTMKKGGACRPKS